LFQLAEFGQAFESKVEQHGVPGGLQIFHQNWMSCLGQETIVKIFVANLACFQFAEYFVGRVLGVHIVEVVKAKLFKSVGSFLVVDIEQHAT
jgi:hypothetical protein